MKIHTTDSSKLDGTSFHGDSILATTNNLRELFGEPFTYTPNDIYDKVTRDWCLELEDGTPFSIYDWKEYRTYGDEENITFHIGAHSKKDSERVFKVLTEEYGLKEGQW